MRLITLSLLVNLALLAAPAAEAADPMKKLASVLRKASDYKQRLAAVIGLARLNDPRAVPLLIDALHDANNTVRGTAANVLGKLGGPQAEAALEALLPRERDSYVLSQAQTALAALIRRGQSDATAPDGLKVAGTRGTLDQDEVQSGIDARMRPATDCFNREFQKAPYLGGKISLLVRVGLDGKVKQVRIGNSDLGSLTAERCIVGVMRGGAYGKPDGGEADFTVPLSFGGGTPPAALDAARSRAGRRLQRLCKKLLVPGHTPPPSLQITLYLTAQGEVANAGLSASGEEIVPALADGMLERLRALNLGQHPEGGVAKMVVPFTCESR